MAILSSSEGKNSIGAVSTVPVPAPLIGAGLPALAILGGGYWLVPWQADFGSLGNSPAPLERLSRVPATIFSYGVIRAVACACACCCHRGVAIRIKTMWKRSFEKVGGVPKPAPPPPPPRPPPPASSSLIEQIVERYGGNFATWRRKRPNALDFSAGCEFPIFGSDYYTWGQKWAGHIFMAGHSSLPSWHWAWR